MKKIALICLLTLPCLQFSFAGSVWQKVNSKLTPSGAARPATANYLLYTADIAALKGQFDLSAKGEANTIDVPMPGGSFMTFKVHRDGLIPPELAQKYPELNTYSGVAADNPRITAKFDFTLYGFHAMVFDGDKTFFIDPADDHTNSYYTVHYKGDELRAPETRMNCSVTAANVIPGNTVKLAQKSTSGGLQKVVNGYQLRTYRLALACDHQYAQKVTGLTAPTVAQTFNKMVTTVSRVNGVYERELAVTMVLVPKEDLLIFIDAAYDPIGIFNDDASSLLGRNQTVCDSIIGNLNYDVGHVFSTGAGGLSQVGSVCQTGMKAQSVTGSAVPYGDGYDIDYVAHEIGHEFGSQHTFNDDVSHSCYANAVAECAYEPGSGSTIMCYAGICGGDNLQPHSDAYFCGSSLEQIHSYINNIGDGCAVKTPTNNKPVYIAPFSASYIIPVKTPFELTAPTAIDSVADSLVTYCWEQWDLGDFGKTLQDTHVGGPIFRSYPPVTSTVRTFPNLKMIFSGSLSNAGTDNASGEKAPDVPRFLKFRLTARNIFEGHGCFVLSADSILVQAVSSGSGFKVTSQNTDNLVLLGGTQQNITWDVSGTSAPPISTSTVGIYMSTDSGLTWSYHIGTLPNTGSATIMLPNPDTTIPAARFKVKGTGNVFFNVNSKFFRLERNFSAAIHTTPNPVHDKLHIEIENSGEVDVAVYNAVGRCHWKGTITGPTDLPAWEWARGMYFIKLVDSQKRVEVRKFVVQ
jgi:hypothetical protein